MGEEGVSMRRDLCAHCGACVAPCPRDARSLSGRMMSVEELVEEVRQHWRIFMQSGGGVTCGGGEALRQGAFLRTLLEKLHEELGFHTCLDTCGHASWSVLESVLPYTDLVLFDIKHMDDKQHRKGTGRGNRVILENAARLGRLAVRTIIRLPLIPGFNDDEDNIRALAAFMRNNELPSVELLPYHAFGASKHEALGKVYTLRTRRKPHSQKAEDILRASGLTVEVAGKIF
jgi:pyruvate formate lyase activating enzyme